MTKDEIIGRFMLLVTQTIIYSPALSITQKEREELAGLIGAYERVITDEKEPSND